jgi:hypothetical protein
MLQSPGFCQAAGELYHQENSDNDKHDKSVSSVPVDIQSEYASIKDTLTRVKLVSDLKVPESRTGIKSGYSYSTVWQIH